MRFLNEALAQNAWVRIDLDRLLEAGTAGTEVFDQPAISETETTSGIEGLGWRRAAARVQFNAAGEAHQRGHFKDWTDRTSRRVRLSTTDILEELGDLGFAWRDIARLLGVTVQALQKWRRGSPATAENKSKLAGLLAACDLIAENYEIKEIASWLEMPIIAGVPISPMDLWLGQRSDLVFDYASGQSDAEETLTAWRPVWREEFRSDFETFRAGDGYLSIRLKGN